MGLPEPKIPLISTLPIIKVFSFQFPQKCVLRMQRLITYYKGVCICFSAEIHSAEGLTRYLL